MTPEKQRNEIRTRQAIAKFSENTPGATTCEDTITDAGSVLNQRDTEVTSVSIHGGAATVRMKSGQTDPFVRVRGEWLITIRPGTDDAQDILDANQGESPTATQSTPTAPQPQGHGETDSRLAKSADHLCEHREDPTPTDVLANMATSCGFARNVADEVLVEVQTGRARFTISARSPTLGKSITMQCEQTTDGAVCTGGKGAVVRIRQT